MTLPDDVLFESFTFPFFDLSYGREMGTGLVDLFLAASDPHPRRGHRGLYIHIPFCETICSFCPFVKFVANNATIAGYVDALQLEIELGLQSPRFQHWTVDSIYFGGGTPSLLTPDQFASLIHCIQRFVKLTADVEITIEAEPKSISKSKMEEFRAAGATRVSFGVQTLDQRLRDAVNLTATARQLSEAIEFTTATFGNTNLDMIAGHPGQTAKDVEEDMRNVARSGVGSISVYPFDYVTALPSFLDRIRNKQTSAVPSSTDRWNLFHTARQTLAEHLETQNMYCFGRQYSPKCRYMFDTLYGGYFDQCLGFGCGAYSMLTGITYQNHQNLAEYSTSLKSRSMPVARATPGHALEKSLVYFPKRLFVDLSEAHELDLADWFTPRCLALLERGLIYFDGDIARLTKSGERKYAQIMVYFLSEHQRRLYDRACRRISQGLNWSFDGPITIDPASIRGVAAKSAVVDLHRVPS